MTRMFESLVAVHTHTHTSRLLVNINIINADKKIVVKPKE